MTAPAARDGAGTQAAPVPDPAATAAAGPARPAPGPTPRTPRGTPTFGVVVPTIGRPSLQRCLDALAAAAGPWPGQVVVVDDRRNAARPLPLVPPAGLADRLTVVAGAARGPAAARNAGWRLLDTDWVVFVDDDVVVDEAWRVDLARDLTAAGDAAAGDSAAGDSAAGGAVAGVQGRLVVPLPTDRRPTDTERRVAGLADARWATADMAYRRDALAAVGGFDERFPRAYREDADLALRLLDSGHRLVRGVRTSRHPVRPAPWWVSLAAQTGNADDPLMGRLHGPGWRHRAGVPRGRRPRHLAVTAAGVAALTALVAGRRGAGLVLLAGWAAGTTEFTLARVRPGPRTAAELAAMAATSVAIPPVAAAYWLAGLVRAARVTRGAARPQPGRDLASARRPGGHPAAGGASGQPR